MSKVNFIELMHKKLTKWGEEELSNFTRASGVYEGLEYNIAGNKVLDNTFIKGRYETANVSLKHRPDTIEFTCDEVTVCFTTNSVPMDVVYVTINSILEIFATQFKSKKK